MKLEEFLQPTPNNETDAEEPVNEEMNEEVELDVQKAVVESLAADKAEQDEKIAQLKNENEALKADITKLRNENYGLKAEIANKRSELEKLSESLIKNVDSVMSNKISLLDRDVDIPDRFEGETRDHVLEVIAEAREKAEKEGCIRRAQLLEGVMLVNEPLGNLRKRRQALEKIFNENANIISGAVINELDKLGISYKNGEEYLLASEIMKRTY